MKKYIQCILKMCIQCVFNVYSMCIQCILEIDFNQNINPVIFQLIMRNPIFKS